jgi:hypothetical protein
VAANTVGAAPSGSQAPSPYVLGRGPSLGCVPMCATTLRTKFPQILRLVNTVVHCVVVSVLGQAMRCHTYCRAMPPGPVATRRSWRMCLPGYPTQC